MKDIEILKELGFSELYLKYAFVSLKEIQEFKLNLINDNHGEHYRYKVLNNFLRSKETIDIEEFEGLIQVLTIDSNSSMVLSFCHDLLNSQKLNNNQFNVIFNLMTSLGENKKKLELILLEKDIHNKLLMEEDMVLLLQKNPGYYDSFARNIFTNSLIIMKELKNSKIKKIRNFAKNRFDYLIKINNG